jgi:inosose dehydratase
MKVGYSAITWGGVVGTAGGVGSIADLFYMADGDTTEAVRDLAAAGYAGTEVFDGDLLAYADRPDALLEVLAAADVELVSVYSGANFIYDDIAEDEFAKIERAAMLASRFGASRLVFGGGARRAGGASAGDIRALGRGLDRAAEIADEYGLAASYHPHLGTLVEAPDALEQLFDACTVAFCPDTAHLAAGGGDPVALIERYGDRLGHVHLKDLDTKRTTFMPLGEGDLDFDAILRAVRQAGYDDWLMVELDAYDGEPRAAAEISRAFLRRRGL